MLKDVCGMSPGGESLLRKNRQEIHQAIRAGGRMVGGGPCVRVHTCFHDLSNRPLVTYVVDRTCTDVF